MNHAKAALGILLKRALSRKSLAHTRASSRSTEGGNPDYVCGYRLGYFLEVDIRNATLLVEEYREGKLAQSGTLAFAGPVRSRSDSVPFSNNESESRKSARAKR
jgi:hypothetical protein